MNKPHSSSNQNYGSKPFNVFRGSQTFEEAQSRVPAQPISKDDHLEEYGFSRPGEKNVGESV